jgi:8-oxo-dGTP diphosphatase
VSEPERVQLTRHSVSVSGVVIDDHGRALLIRRRDNLHWEPPGGVLELGETIHDGLRREVRQETGLDVDPVALTGVYKNMTRAIVGIVFRCKITGGALATNDEAAAFHWATEAEATEMMTEAFAIRVLDALRSPDMPAVRSHDGICLL